MTAPKIIIKKYENRRLYDSAQSRYVNLEDIAAIIRQGHDVQVVDAKTGEDVTRSILTQIIVDESKGKDSGLPVDLLKQIIVSSEQARLQFLEWYFKSAIDTFERMQSQFRGFQTAQATNPLDAMMNLFRGVPGSVPFMPFMPFQPMPGLSPEPRPKGGDEHEPRPQGGDPQATPQSAPPPAEPNAEVQELKRRLEELERHITAKSGSGKRKK